MRPLNEKFTPMQSELKATLDESMNVWFDSGKSFNVEMIVYGHVSEYFKARKYFPAQKMEKENRDGSIILKSTVHHRMEVIPEVLKWIPYIRVTKPIEVCKEINRRVDLYAGDK